MGRESRGKDLISRSFQGLIAVEEEDNIENSLNRNSKMKPGLRQCHGIKKKKMFQERGKCLVKCC